MSKVLYGEQQAADNNIDNSTVYSSQPELRGIAAFLDGLNPSNGIKGFFIRVCCLCAAAALITLSVLLPIYAFRSKSGDTPRSDVPEQTDTVESIDRLKSAYAETEKKLNAAIKQSAEYETEINSLISKTEEVVRRLEDLDNTESQIREQVGLESQAENGEAAPVQTDTDLKHTGVGGPLARSYLIGVDMAFSDKLDYAQYLVEYVNIYMDLIENKYTELSSNLEDYYEFVPHIWPVQGESRAITSRFGWRIDPISGSGYEYHSGLDIADDYGSDIFSAATGTVISAQYSEGYGYNILIDHKNGYMTRYSHCSLLLVENGDEVTQGQLIAYMGSTGRSTGSHCDFRVYLDGSAINPEDILDLRDSDAA